MILLVDNYDSFVYNLARYFECLGQQTLVVRNDRITLDEIAQLGPEALVISPGPCTPTESGVSLEVARTFLGRIPILGVCLGHQVIAASLGAKIIRAAEPIHGRTSRILHDQSGVFVHAPNPLTVCRYHSLVVAPESMPDSLEVSSRSAEDTIMSIRHREHLCVGLQFHPESILTQAGYQLLGNFLMMGGIEIKRPGTLNELAPSRTPARTLPTTPITF